MTMIDGAILMYLVMGWVVGETLHRIAMRQIAEDKTLRHRDVLRVAWLIGFGIIVVTWPACVIFSVWYAQHLKRKEKK